MSDVEGTIRQTQPQRPFATVDHAEDVLTVVFTMREGLGLGLETSDAETGEPVSDTWFHYSVLR